MDLTRIMNRLCRKLGGRKNKPDSKATAELSVDDLETLREDLNFRLLCEELQLSFSGDKVLWVEEIRLISNEPAPRETAPKKKFSLWGRMKNCLLGRQAF